MIGFTLQRMIFGQLVRVFVLAWLAITGLFLLAGLVQEAAQRGLTPPQILTAMPLLIPSTLAYTVPATVLFASCVVYGRMAQDHEITAVRAAGVHLGKLLLPGMVFAGLVATVLVVLQQDIIPSSRQRLADRVLADVDELVYSMLRRQGCIRHPQLPFAVFVREVRGKQLINPVFKRRNADGSYAMVAHAKEATLWTDLSQDKIYIFMPQCVVVGSEADGNHGNLRDQRVDVSFPVSTFRDTQVRPMNMTREQLAQKRIELRDERATREEQLQVIEGQTAGLSVVPEPLQQLRNEHERRIKESRRLDRLIVAEEHMRPALAVGSLVFALVAFPVGIRFHRGDYLSSFVSCFVPVVLVYYPLLLAGTNFAREGRLPAAISVWLADAAALVAGTMMVRRLFRN